MMDVNLISYSQPAVDVDIPNDILQLVAFCARVSNPDNQNNEKTAESLVKYLIKHINSLMVFLKYMSTMEIHLKHLQ